MSSSVIGYYNLLHFGARILAGQHADARFEAVVLDLKGHVVVGEQSLLRVPAAKADACGVIPEPGHELVSHDIADVVVPQLGEEIEVVVEPFVSA